MSAPRKYETVESYVSLLPLHCVEQEQELDVDEQLTNDL